LKIIILMKTGGGAACFFCKQYFSHVKHRDLEA
jgi:hypothetical protein